MSASSKENARPFKLVPVENHLFDGFQLRFQEVFGAPSVWTTTTDRVRAIDRLFPDKNKNNVQYPYALFKLTSGTLSLERRHNRDLATRGIPVEKSTDENSALYVRLLPMDYTVQIEYITNSFSDVLAFTSAWVFAAKQGRLAFQIKYGMSSLDIKSTLEASINYPQREGDSQSAAEYIAEVSVVIEGFTSEPKPFQMDVIKEVDISMEVAKLDGSEGEIFWQFNTPKAT